MDDFSFIHSPGMSREDFNKKIKDYIDDKGTSTSKLYKLLQTTAENIRKRNLDVDDSGNPIVPKL